jgi:hypothetical protein
VSFGFASYGAGGGLELQGFDAVEQRKYFDIEQFPFFDQPFALNTAAPAPAGLPLVVWVRGSKSKGTPSAFHTLAGPKAAPVLDVASGGDVYVFVAGGTTGGQRDASVLVGMNATHLLHRSAASDGLTAARLPATFAKPVEFACAPPPLGCFSSSARLLLGLPAAPPPARAGTPPPISTPSAPSRTTAPSRSPSTRPTPPPSP